MLLAEATVLNLIGLLFLIRGACYLVVFKNVVVPSLLVPLLVFKGSFDFDVLRFVDWSVLIRSLLSLRPPNV